jgi:Protein of unknown function (DUF998)
MAHARTGFPNAHEGAKYVSQTRQTLTRLLLVCGILSAVLYAAVLVFVPLRWAGYSSASRTVSELSAIGAPTRSLWAPLGMLWTFPYIAFGWGVWRAARGRRTLHALGAVIIGAGIFGFFWPPMHQREVLAAGGKTLTDTLHVVWTVLHGLLALLAMGLGAAAWAKPFRLFSIATMAVLVVTGKRDLRRVVLEDPLRRYVAAMCDQHELYDVPVVLLRT